MLNGLGLTYPTATVQGQITNLNSFYPTAPYEPVQSQITDLASFYPTMTQTQFPINTGGTNSGGYSPNVIEAAVQAGVTPTVFTQQAVNAGYTPTQWANMAAAQRQAALASGAVPSGAPSALSAANLTPILLIGGAVLLLITMKK
jgi:hypothetical protein